MRHLAFMIHCAVRQPDGSKSPFQVSSDITLSDLRHRVAEKLERFPDHVVLRYRLDIDKASAGPTSIKTDEELKFFKDKMRDLTVPQRLPSGKLSTRPRKTVHVCFEDVGVENTGLLAPSNGNSKVCIRIYILLPKSDV